MNVRAVRDRLFGYLRQLRHGHVLLAVNRRNVSAELQRPTTSPHALDAPRGREQKMAGREGLRTGISNPPEAYPSTGVRLPGADIDAALA